MHCSVQIAEDGGMDGEEDNWFYVGINLSFQIQDFLFMFDGDNLFLVNIYLHSEIVLILNFPETV